MFEIPAVFAHGVGSRGTLPLPLWQFSWAAIAALGLSFAALGVLWKKPTLAPAAHGVEIPLSRVALRVLAWPIRAVGLLMFGLTLGAALFGTNVGGPESNLAPVTIYVAVWVGVAVVSAVTGDIWKLINPFQTIGRFFPETTTHKAPEHQFVAVGTIFGFLVLELVHPNGDIPRNLGWAMLAYTALMVGGLFRFGRLWLDRADGFGVLFSMIAAMAPITRGTEGELRLRPPMSGLSVKQAVPGSLLLLVTVLGGTSFDGFSESPMFTDIVGRPTGWDAVPPKFIGLVLMIAIAGILYSVGSQATAKVAGMTKRDAADLFSASLVPIVWGYAVAHYAQLLVDEMQNFWIMLSNPYGAFDAAGNPTTNLFGAADNTVDLNVIDVDVVAWVQALAIVVGHVFAVIYSHEVAVGRLDHKTAARSQQTMLFVMVLYSVAGLWLLFSA